MNLKAVLELRDLRTKGLSFGTNFVLNSQKEACESNGAGAKLVLFKNRFTTSEKGEKCVSTLFFTFGLYLLSLSRSETILLRRSSALCCLLAMVDPDPECLFLVEMPQRNS